MSNDLYQKVTDYIISQLLKIEQTGDNTNWLCPWTGTDPSVFPYNILTGAPYTGINVLLCWMSSMEHGYPTNKWMTFKQMLTYGQQHEIELSVKGEKSTKLVKVLEFKPKDAEPGDPFLKRTKVFNVFNSSQIKGLPAEVSGVEVPTPYTFTYSHADAFVKGTKATIKHHPNQAFFQNKADYIAIPPITDFKSEAHYFATLFHELGHWTGHASRLDRDQRGGKFSKAYAFEELVAEITSAFFANYFALDGSLQHVDYIQHYVTALKSDTTIVKSAASKAQKAYEFLHDLQPNKLDVAV